MRRVGDERSPPVHAWAGGRLDKAHCRQTLRQRIAARKAGAPPAGVRPTVIYYSEPLA